MRRALAGRLVFAVALVLFAFVGAYLLTAAAPGDPLDDGMRSPEAIARMRARLGLDQPVFTRLATRVSRLAVLDLGTSIRYDQPVLTLVTQRTVSTLQAGVLALVLALAIGIPAGVAGSRARSPVVRHGIRIVSIVLLSLPALVVALVLAVIASGTGLPALVVMVVSLALPAAAIIERLQARAMDAVQHDICLDAARARGVPAARIAWRHAWPLSLSSVLGVIGVIAGHLLSGALAIELVTSRTGLGLLTYEALMARDFDLAAGCAAAAALLVGLATLAADMTQMWIDPRSRA
jgi:peptide/nickel transport system permease protein